MKRLIPIALMLSLSGCNLAGLGFPTQSPPPLASTTIDDQALDTAWRAFDVALDALNVLGDMGVIVPGTPRGKSVASAIRKVNAGLNAAERFAAAGSAKNYRAALVEAEAGMTELRTVLKGN